MWVERIFGLIPEEQQPRWRKVGHDIYRTVGGYITGNLLISLIAGVSSGIVMWLVGMPFVIALGLLVGLLDLIPWPARPSPPSCACSSRSRRVRYDRSDRRRVFFIAYQQLENHVIQPLVYGRTVQLSPLAVLVSVLVGAQLAGVLGALAAIPIAGAIQVLIVDWRANRTARRAAQPAQAAP
jgi:Predicted permease